MCGLLIEASTPASTGSDEMKRVIGVGWVRATADGRVRVEPTPDPRPDHILRLIRMAYMEHFRVVDGKVHLGFQRADSVSDSFDVRLGTRLLGLRTSNERKGTSRKDEREIEDWRRRWLREHRVRGYTCSAFEKSRTRGTRR